MAPSGLRVIGGGAFLACERLQRLKLNKKLEKICDHYEDYYHYGAF